jgi:hypothetical protein
MIHVVLRIDITENPDSEHFEIFPNHACIFQKKHQPKMFSSTIPDFTHSKETKQRDYAEPTIPAFTPCDCTNTRTEQVCLLVLYYCSTFPVERMKTVYWGVKNRQELSWNGETNFQVWNTRLTKLAVKFLKETTLPQFLENTKQGQLFWNRIWKKHALEKSRKLLDRLIPLVCTVALEGYSDPKAYHSLSALFLDVMTMGRGVPVPLQETMINFVTIPNWSSRNHLLRMNAVKTDLLSSSGLSPSMIRIVNMLGG